MSELVVVRDADGLPRPETLGPLWPERDTFWNLLVAALRDDPVERETARRRIDDLNLALGDCEAIAALPEWIAAHDSQRERAERAEAEVELLREALSRLEAMATSMSDAMPDWQALSIADHLLRRRIVETRRALRSIPAEVPADGR